MRHALDVVQGGFQRIVSKPDMPNPSLLTLHGYDWDPDKDG